MSAVLSATVQSGLREVTAVWVWAAAGRVPMMSKAQTQPVSRHERGSMRRIIDGLLRDVLYLDSEAS